MDINELLDTIHVDASDMWENEEGPKSWCAVATDDDGIIAYFSNPRDAFRFRLDLINRRLNP